MRKVLSQIERSGKAESFRWIASYESLRDPDIIDALERTQPAIDLLILDEAHRVRNPATLQYRLARQLRQSAMAVLLLTATPVQTSLENLHTLLDLLEPDANDADTTTLALVRPAPFVAPAFLDRSALDKALVCRRDGLWCRRCSEADTSSSSMRDGTRLAGLDLLYTGMSPSCRSSAVITINTPIAAATMVTRRSVAGREQGTVEGWGGFTGRIPTWFRSAPGALGLRRPFTFRSKLPIRTHGLSHRWRTT